MNFFAKTPRQIQIFGQIFDTGLPGGTGRGLTASMIHPDDLRYFKEIGLTGNLRRAAERLGVTQPALSHALKRLEEDLGCELVIRSKTGVRMTRAGEKLASLSGQLEEVWSRIQAVVSDENEIVTGTYRLGVHTALAQYTLPLFLGDLLKEHPKLNFRFEHGLSRQIAESLISNRLDFGIVVNPPQHPDLVIRKLCEDVVKMWKSPKLKNPDVIICDPDIHQTQILLRTCKKKGINFIREIHTSSLEVVAQLTAEGVGVGIIPERVLKAMTGEPCQLYSKDAPEFKDTICLVYKKENQNTMAAKVISDSIKAGFLV